MITKSYNRTYRPLQLLTYGFDYRIWKLNPFGFHLTNILFHLFNALLIYYLLCLLFGNNPVYGFGYMESQTIALPACRVASIMFLIHPIHTSVVSYISGRADLLACFFMLLSMIMFLKFIKLESIICYAFSLFFAALALLSRESALILFLFIALLLFLNNEKPKRYLYLLPFILLGLLYLGLRISVFGREGLVVHASLVPLFFRVINFFGIILRYLWLLIFPLDLHLCRTIPVINYLLDIRTLLVIVFVFFSIFILIKLRKNKLVVFSALWFIIGLTPVFAYMDAYAFFRELMMAESWLYVSSCGFFIIFAFCLNLKEKVIKRAAYGSIIIFWSFLTIVNNGYWKNDLILHENILEQSPESNYLRINLIQNYLNLGLYEDALAETKKFSAYYPDTGHLYLVWGEYYLALGKLDKAIENYKMALNKDRKIFYASQRLALCYKELGEPEKALEFILESIKTEPYCVSSLVLAGDLYSVKKDFLKADKYYYLALEIDPGDLSIKEKIKNAE
ncbi:MAG: hypothetical protein Q8L26_00575 [Candidatus Omnitrophota bacterium]|nr:hypothetical protein [Candidatus Omnitrophota bacterium]